MRFSLAAGSLQLLLLLLLGIAARYDDAANSIVFNNVTANAAPTAGTSAYNPANEAAHIYYPMYQDVHVMIYVGFGFLMTFLKRYGFSSVSINLLISAISLQLALVVKGFIGLRDGVFTIGVVDLLGADFATAAVLISFGSLLGKLSPLQALVLAVLEIPIFAANEYICVHLLRIVDMGGSMLVHTFGAYFGLCASRALNSRAGVSSSSTSPTSVSYHPRESSNYHSDLFSMIGTLFLWLFWPSFNSALAAGDDRHRAIVNTVLALAGSAVAAVAVSPLASPDRKISMSHVQNATLAGGVAVGTAADFMLQPWAALCIGCLAGAASTVGFAYGTPKLNSLKFHDTCGVHNLHGIPGVMAGLFGALFTALASVESYGNGLYSLFPAMAPKTIEGRSYRVHLREQVLDIQDGLGRSSLDQALFQAAALGVTLIIAAVGGAVAGLALRLPVWENLTYEDLYSDERFWTLPDELFEPTVTAPQLRDIRVIGDCVGDNYNSADSLRVLAAAADVTSAI